MTKLSVLFATAIALASPGMAHAASPEGDHVFVGFVEVQKNMGVWTDCTLTAVINVTAGVPKLKSASLTGVAPCGNITFPSLPSNPLFVVTSPMVRVPAINIFIPPFLFFPADACAGNLDFVWGSNSAIPRNIRFFSGTSDVPDGNPDHVGATEKPCLIAGTISQTSTPRLNL